MLVFGALSFNVLPDDSVEIISTGKQHLNYADVQELTNWLQHYSITYRDTRSLSQLRNPYPPPVNHWPNDVAVPHGQALGDIAGMQAAEAAPGHF